MNFESIKKNELAIFGGSKIRELPMPPRMAYGDNELNAIKELFKSYEARKLDFGYQDEFENKYTNKFIEYLCEGGYADAVCTGTASLFVAVAALELPKGSHIITSPITDPGTLSAIILNGHVPVLADSMPDSYNVGIDEVEARMNNKVKAILVVHAAGKAAPIDSICDMASQHNIQVIEDCSQAHGAELNGKKVGVFGDISAFSTMYRKSHGTGGCGGVVYTKNINLYHLIRAYSDRGKPVWEDNFDEKNPNQFLFPALNLHLDEISSAIGICSLEKLDKIRKKRIEYLKCLSDKISTQSIVCKPSSISNEDSPFFFPIHVDDKLISCRKTEFATAIRGEGIDINPHYRYLVYDWPWIKKYLSDDFKTVNAEKVINNSFNILFNENYTEQEAEDTVNAIKKIEGYFYKNG